MGVLSPAGSTVPQAPRCRASQDTVIDVSWYCYTGLGADRNELRYRSEHDDGWITLPPTPDHTATVDGLEPGVWHDFQMRWLDRQGRPSPWSDTTFCWPLSHSVFSTGVDIEAYRQWVCQCAICLGCRWYQPCGRTECRPRVQRRTVVAINDGHAGFLDEMATAVLDEATAQRLGRALTGHSE